MQKGGKDVLGTSEEKLIKLCKAKNREGYNLLFEKYEKYIYKICYHYTASREDALDLLQEVYIKIFKAFDRFNEKQPLLPWIKRITINTCLSFIRIKREQTLSLSSPIDGGENTVEDLVASSINVEDEVGFTDTKRALEEMIKELPKDLRMVLILRHMEDMSYDEISKAMACPVGTVKTHLFRGRKILKDKLQSAGIWGV